MQSKYCSRIFYSILFVALISKVPCDNVKKSQEILFVKLCHDFKLNSFQVSSLSFMSKCRQNRWNQEIFLHHFLHRKQKTHLLGLCLIHVTKAVIWTEPHIQSDWNTRSALAGGVKNKTKLLSPVYLSRQVSSWTCSVFPALLHLETTILAQQKH